MRSVERNFIPDGDVKEHLPQQHKNTSSMELSFIPDGSFLEKEIPIFFEYENSSRGMVWIVSKYLNFAHVNKTKIKVVIIESEQHFSNHSNDTLYARNLIELADSAYVSFDFHKSSDVVSLRRIVKHYIK